MSDDHRDGAIEQPATAAGRSRVLSIIVLLTALAAGGLAGWALIGPRVLAATGAHDAVDVDERDHDDGHGGGQGRRSAGRGETLHMLENLVVNPAETQGTRFLVATLALEMDSPASAARLAERDAEARDALIGVLGSKTVTELSDVRRRDDLKAELVQALGALIPNGRVRSVYLPQFVIQ